MEMHWSMDPSENTLLLSTITWFKEKQSNTLWRAWKPHKSKVKMLELVLYFFFFSKEEKQCVTNEILGKGPQNG